jgi:transcription elongation GreA/GreB family factor
VGPYESNVSSGKLSIDSPVGRCLLGRGEGEEVTVYAPSGMRIYRILSIEI